MNVVDLAWARHNIPMPRKPSNDERPHREVGDRLRLMMAARDLSGVQVAHLLGIGTTRWSNYVVGISRLPHELALKLQIYGVSLEWLYSGDKRHLTYEFANAITKAEAALQKSERPRPTARR
jgi:plasmid maintenance system antidote protein VapI